MTVANTPDPRDKTAWLERMFARWDSGYPGGVDAFLRLFPDVPDSVAAKFRTLINIKGNLGGKLPNTFMDDAIPTQIGRFRVLGELGKGGMGRVFQAHDPNLDRVVAVKVILGDAAAGSRWDRFRSEAEILARLNHPHIVPIHEFGEDGGCCFFVMEKAGRGALSALANRVNPPHEVARLMVQISGAMAAAHRAGFLHRDLKPDNVLLYDLSGVSALDCAWGYARISDFGLAKKIDTPHVRSIDGVPMGSPPYMAPEQVSGNLSAHGIGTDVWGLGVILYEMLTGRKPFTGADRDQLFNQICTATPPPPSAFNREVPPALDAICLKCLAKDPRDRWPRADELAAALEKQEIWTAPTVPARAPVPAMPPMPVPRPPASHRRTWIAPAVIVGASILVIIAVEVVKYWEKTKDNTVSQAKAFEAGETRKFEIAPGMFMDFVWVPPGNTLCGSPREEEEYINKTVFKDDWLMSGWHMAELGRQYSTLGFWLGKYTVTQAEWKAVMGNNNNPSNFNGFHENKAQGMNTGRFPVDGVSWDDCQQFLTKLNQGGGIEKVFERTGKFVLPHEDQWEYACRGGKGNSPFYWGFALNGTQANCNGTVPFGQSEPSGIFLQRTCAVDDTNNGKYEKHPWGLCHMSGNVWQWCSNLYDFLRGNGLGLEAKSEPQKNRVTRGGSWVNKPWECRSAYRSYYMPDFRGNNGIGFRVCVSMD